MWQRVNISLPGFMQSLLSRFFVPIAIVVCVALVMDLSAPEATDPALADEVPQPVVVAARVADAAEFPPRTAEEPQLKFGGYPCRNDCADHLAGYAWAEEHGISEADNCDGLSAAFIEGCRVYAENRTVAVAALN